MEFGNKFVPAVNAKFSGFFVSTYRFRISDQVSYYYNKKSLTVPAGLSEGAVIGIAVGVSVFVLLLIIGVIFFLFIVTRGRSYTREKGSGSVC